MSEKNVSQSKEKNSEQLLEQLRRQEVVNKTVPAKEKKEEEAVEETIDPSIERFLDTPITEGLSEEQVNSRIEAGLVNTVKDDKGKSILSIVLSNIFTFFNILYFIIAGILIYFKSWNNLGFLAVVIPNLLIAIFQEIRAKKAVDKLTLMSAPTVIVIRNSIKLEIPINEVVLDDIVFFTPGKQICADSIVVEGSVEANESLLTGESDSIVKNVGDELLSGSFIVSGVCVARVNKIGKDNYIEKVSRDAKQYSAPKSELLYTLKGIIKVISIIIIPISILYLWSAGVFSDASKLTGAIQETAFIVLAMIPAGLFLLTTVALSVGVIRLNKSNTLVQELYCIEMLARVDVLCLDKTGTITDGSMRVCDCVEVKNHTDYTIREIVGSMMNAFEDVNPTSEALIRYFDKNDVLTATGTIPFSSKRKYSAVTFGEEGTFIIGAPDFVLKDNLDKVESKVARFAKQGCRVLVLGQTNIKITDDELPRTVKPLALIVIQDHIREDAADTINFFKHNGVDVKVISGDNPETVSHIAKRVGIENAERFINLNGLTDDEVREAVFEYTVFGRVNPNQKRLIVQELKAHKKTVAMTGDGVNDILALKEADCSIAMAAGSDAVRYASHLVLMDSNFSSMPKVVNEGRRVVNNIQKTSSLYLAKNLFAIMLAIMYIVTQFTSKKADHGWPFVASHLYLIEYFILGVATFCLAIQPNTDIIKGKFLGNVFRQILPGALTILIFHLILYFLRDSGFFLGLADKNVYSIIAALVTTAVMLFVLFQTCTPFNWFRKIVFSVVCVAIAVTLVFIPKLVSIDFAALEISEILLLIILLQAAYPLMWCVSFVLTTLRIVPKKAK